jgi:hypothetical protein
MVMKRGENRRAKRAKRSKAVEKVKSVKRKRKQARGLIYKWRYKVLFEQEDAT